MAQWLANPTSNHEVTGSILGLAQSVKDLVLLWLWGRPAAIAPIRPSLGTSMYHGCSPKKPKKKKAYDMTLYMDLYEMTQMHVFICVKRRLFLTIKNICICKK